MAKKKQDKNLAPKRDETLGKHHGCVGTVKLKRAGLGSIRYCEKCDSSNDKGSPVFTQYEASLWK